MKRILANKILIPAMIAFVAFACVETEFPVFDQAYTAFEASSLSVSEGNASTDAAGNTVLLGNTTEIVLQRGGTAELNSELGVQVTVTSEYLSTNDFVTAGDDASDAFTLSKDISSLTFPAGAVNTSFTLTTVNDIAAKGDVKLTFVISSVSDSKYQIGWQDSQARDSLSFIIVDDDCPIDINAWTGTYTVEEMFTSGVNSPNGLSFFFGETYQVELSPVPGDATGTKVVINNSTGFNNYFDNGTVMSFVTCPKEVSFDAGFPRIAEWNVYAFANSSYDENQFKITCSGPFLTFGPYEFVLTKQ